MTRLSRALLVFREARSVLFVFSRPLLKTLLLVLIPFQLFLKAFFGRKLHNP